MSVLTIPVKVAKKLETIQCCFLWGDEEGRRRYHLAKWEEMKLPLELGGLGLRSMVEMNLAVQGKWIWRYMRVGDNLWKTVVEACWGNIGGGGPLETCSDFAGGFVEKYKSLAGHKIQELSNAR